MDIFAKVREFNETVLNDPFPSKPARSIPDKVKTHLPVFIEEELNELKQAISNQDAPETVDALVDLVYFALGGMHQMGVDANRAIGIVHQANMAKKRGVKPNRGLEGDATKPSDWTPPDLSVLFD